MLLHVINYVGEYLLIQIILPLGNSAFKRSSLRKDPSKNQHFINVVDLI